MNPGCQSWWQRLLSEKLSYQCLNILNCAYLCLLAWVWGACNACVRRQFAGQFSAWGSWGLDSGQISGLVTHSFLTEPSSRALLIILISFWLKWFFCLFPSVLFHWFLVRSLLFLLSAYHGIIDYFCLVSDLRLKLPLLIRDICSLLI